MHPLEHPSSPPGRTLLSTMPIMVEIDGVSVADCVSDYPGVLVFLMLWASLCQCFFSPARVWDMCNAIKTCRICGKCAVVAALCMAIPCIFAQ